MNVFGALPEKSLKEKKCFASLFAFAFYSKGNSARHYRTSSLCYSRFVLFLLHLNPIKSKNICLTETLAVYMSCTSWDFVQVITCTKIMLVQVITCTALFFIDVW